MYIHIGSGYFLSTDLIVGVFEYKENEIMGASAIDISFGKPKAYIVKKDNQIIKIPINISTFKKRWEECKI